MIVGNGLISNSFKRYENDDNIIIFASGVSNSSDSSYDNFKREIDLLNEYLYLENKKLVYFSTCSIEDESINKTHYVLHKKNMENIIRTYHNNYIIIRLPIVVGKTTNKNTFFNRVRNNILDGETIKVFKNATRYLIDIDDISKISPYIIDNETNKTINVCFDNKMFVLDIINIMAQVLLKNINITLMDFGSDYNINNSEFNKILIDNGLKISDEYTKDLIRKYLC